MRYNILFLRISLFLFLLLTSVQSWSSNIPRQDRLITGSVSDSKTGEALIGATVTIPGLESSGTVTDLEGRYSITLPSGYNTLSFSYIGYVTKTVEVNDNSVIDVWLLESMEQLDEVVITAVGIAANKRGLGYSVEEVGSKDIENANEANLVSALSGKAAGVVVTSASGSPGAAANIRVRGNKSINGSNAPLFIVDGIPIDNTSTGNGTVGVDVSNRAIDINPNDIEKMSVLKGPAATALYGIRAANGAVIITTKKGSAGKPRVSIKSSYGLNQVNKLPARQYTYAQGVFSGGNMVYRGPETGEASSYGPKMTDLEYDGDPTYIYDMNGHLVPVGSGNGVPANIYDPYETFFVNGHTIDNNVSVTGGSEKFSYYLSAGNYLQMGVVPKSDWNRTSFKSNVEVKLNERISIGSNTTVIRSGGDRITRGNALSGVGIGLYRTPISFDIGNGKTGREAANDPDTYIFNNGEQRAYRGSNGYDNPFWSVNKVLFNDNVTRIIQSASINYQMAPWLTASYKLGFDHYSDKRSSVWDINSGSESLGRVDLATILSTDINSDLLFLVKKEVQDFTIDATFGHNFFYSSFGNRTIQGSELTKQGFFHISNASDISASESLYRRQLFGVFSDIRLRWKNLVYINLTGRNDWSSTLPLENNSIFYPTASLGFEFTELLGLTNSKVLSYGKLRLSYGEVGNDPSTYLTANYYQQASADGDNLIPGNDFPAYGLNAFERSAVLGNGNLRAETTATFEAGGEFKFFLGRVSMDLTYYKAVVSDVIVNADISAASGFTTAPVNAGEITNEGIEIMLNLVPVQTMNLRWEVDANFTKFENIVTSLPEGIDQLSLTTWSSFASLHIEGEPYGVLVGTAYQRNEEGELIIGADGWPLVNTEQIILGDPNPDWIAGIRNSVTYKNLRFSALLDIRKGGDIWNGTRGMMNYLGVGEESGLLREVTDYVYEGVTETGEPNTTPVDFANPANGPTGILWRKYGSLGLAEWNVEDASWIRLREVALSYTLPPRWFTDSFVNGISLSVSGRNLWLWTRYSGVDPETNLQGDSNTTGWDYFNLPNTKGIMGTISMSF